MGSGGKLPISLGKSPLVEALFEVRFEPTSQASADLLPGLLFAQIGSEYGSVRPLPMASVPAEFREQDPNLRYQAYHQMTGDKRHIQVGQRMVALSATPDYPGWQTYKGHVLSLLKALGETGQVRTIERFSFRYINVLPAETGAQLPLLNARFELRNAPVSESGFLFRTEIPDGDLLHIVQLFANATPSIPAAPPRKGLLVDVDTLNSDDAKDLLTEPNERLERTHLALKRMFFSLLLDKTIEQLEPQWSEQ